VLHVSPTNTPCSHPKCQAAGSCQWRPASQPSFAGPGEGTCVFRTVNCSAVSVEAVVGGTANLLSIFGGPAGADSANESVQAGLSVSREAAGEALQTVAQCAVKAAVANLTSPDQFVASTICIAGEKHSATCMGGL
jgi:hypothetical protein